MKRRINMNLQIASRLQAYRKKSGLSQEQLAEKIGVSRQAVSKWERSEASPDTDNLIELSKIYGVSLDELMLGTEEPQVNNTDNDTTEPTDTDKTEYVKKEHVSFKNGFHVENDKDKVDIGLKRGINVESKDGSKVHVGFDGIHVQEGDKVRAYTDEDGNVMVDKEVDSCHCASKKHSFAKSFPVWAIALAAMLAWGFSGALFGFGLSWICFLAIPLYYSLVDAIIKRNLTHFAYPVLCVVFYIIAGYFHVMGGWGFGWIVFLTIPVYYAIAALFARNKK